ncbi:MAG: carboxypeptidase regulatory-like domain-containing protein [Bacteroidota bacterium]
MSTVPEAGTPLWAARRAGAPVNSAPVTVRLLVLLGAALLGAGASAQSASVFGVAVDAEAGGPVVGATVVLDDGAGTRRGRAAGTEGEFAFTGLPPGEYALRVSAVGYAATDTTLVLGFGDRVDLAVPLRPEARTMGGVSVQAEAAESPREAGLTRLYPADVSALPTPDPGGDLAAALLLQAGVTTAGDRGGQLSVRGGTPTQNLVLVDGIPLFQPFHLLSSYSALPAGVVRSADVYAGGFPARFGGRIASVVDVTGRTANKNRLDGAVTLSPFLAGVEVEVPVVPGDVSVMASARESLVQEAAAQVGVDLPYRFRDAYAKAHARLDATSSLQATVLRSFDEGTLGRRTPEADPGRPEAGPRDVLTQRTEAAGGQFFSISSAFAAALDVSAYWSRHTSTFAPSNAPPRTSTSSVFGGRFGYVYYLGPHTVRTGIQASTYRFEYAFDARFGGERVSTSEGTVYVDADLGLGAVRIEPGVRVQAFPSQARSVSVEPRLLASWAGGGHVVRAAGGVYRQEIIGLTDQRDIGDVFTAWSTTIRGAPVPRAVDALAGWEGPVAPGLRLGAEGYLKRLSGQTILVDGRLLSTNGDAAGLDLTASVRRGGLRVDARYGFSAVTYRDAERTYRPPFDRPHRATLTARYARGGWAAGLAFQVTSGRPASRVRGTYRDLSDIDLPGGFPGDIATAPGDPTVLFEAEPYATRTPSYHRLDVSVERAIRIGRAEAVLQASVVNATDRANVFYYDALRDERVDQLPLLPSLGLRVEID